MVRGVIAVQWCLPNKTLSMTVKFGKLFVSWKVRTRPILGNRCGLKPVIFFSLKYTCPLSGLRNPLIKLNTVVLPAPLGPMNPTSSPD